MSAYYLIRLEDNRGVILETIQDASGVVDDFLKPFSKKRGGLLQYVDPYGTTIFNGIQAEALLPELEEARSSANSADARDLLNSLERIARQCADEPHLFLKFLGD